MKRVILAACLFMITASVSAAEITFLENPVWSTVLEKAKKENKMIFLDGYTTWCGPCKKMDAETYKDQAVADYYNANFINVKYDMEKGEGVMLAERFLVTAYPNLMFINTDGVMLHKGVGFLEAADFVSLGKTAKDPDSQYFTLKKKAMELTNARFEKFAVLAIGFEDQDFDQLSKDYLAKQADILGNAVLIDLIMQHINALPDEKALAYIAKNQAKITSSGKYTVADFEERIIGLTIDYAVSDAVQSNADDLDFNAIKTLLDKYVPADKAFFVLHYFKTQYLLGSKKVDEAILAFDEILNNTPAKINIDQLCNAMMGMGPVLLSEGKLDGVLKKFEVTQFPADKTYMKDFTKAIIYIKAKDFDKFKVIANGMIASTTTPEKIKEELKAALLQIK